MRFYDPNDSISNLAGNLPHWRQDGVTYFVTFRTIDSIPQSKLREWRREHDAWIAHNPEPHSADLRRTYNRLFTERLHEWLDAGYGKCVLREASLRRIVEEALQYFDGKRYQLDEYVVVPNHVHAIVTPLGSHELSSVLHSWKSYTATQINRRLRVSGKFWQQESFDHIVRSPGQLERIRAYIRDHREFERERAWKARLP